MLTNQCLEDRKDRRRGGGKDRLREGKFLSMKLSKNQEDGLPNRADFLPVISAKVIEMFINLHRH